MHKRRVLVFMEPAVHTILLRRLTKQGYRVYPKVRLSDAIGKDDGERLSDREFGYFTKAHLDFVVVKNDMPVFAVEFDGQSHAAPEAVERDVLKNRLCKAADLPLLRITAAELTERDQHTILDYMLMRYVAWQDEIGGILEEIREFAETLADNPNPEDYAVDCDPSFHFDLRHPFPGTALVRERLWRDHRIAWNIGDGRSDPTARLFCDATGKAMGNFDNDQFTTCTVSVSVWKPGADAKRPIFTHEAKASIRSWLPLQPSVPPPSPALFNWSSPDFPAAVDEFECRVESMWFPSLPGISPWDIAENYAEYLGFRAIEQWAKASRFVPA